MTTFCGRWNGVTHHGEICRNEVAEFLESCRNAGWDSVAVAEGYHILGAFRNGRIWVRDAA